MGNREERVKAILKFLEAIVDDPRLLAEPLCFKPNMEVIKMVIKILKTLHQEVGICKWKYEKRNVCYATQCGDACVLGIATLRDLNYQFCPHCGLKIKLGQMSGSKRGCEMSYEKRKEECIYFLYIVGLTAFWVIYGVGLIATAIKFYHFILNW